MKKIGIESANRKRSTAKIQQRKQEKENLNCTFR